jgi:asparagine synthetase B (glutamine-hydrolysing)
MGGLAVTMELTDLIGSAIDTNLSEADANGREAGIVLSGGLDSSTVACLAENVQPGLPTFTGWYDEPGFDERPYASIVASLLSGEHHEIEITPEDFVEHFDGMKAHVKPPIMGMGTFGQYMVARYIAQNTNVTMVLSGEGSDELFGGYARQSIVAGEPRPSGYENYLLPEGYPITIEEALQYDYDLLPDLLAVDDQMTGAWGLQARAPFTDERIVNYGLSLPVSERIGKRHLRERVRGIVPDAIIDRTDKMGFPIPLVAWTQREPVRSFVLDRIGYLPDPGNPWARHWWVDLVSR